MIKLVRYEFRKLWTRAAAASLLSLLILTALFSFLFFVTYAKAITGSGEEIDGIRGVRAVQQEGRFLTGKLNQEYLDKLKQSYTESAEKEVMQEDLGRYIHKYSINSFLNIARKGAAATNYDLDLDWITTESDFYQRYQSKVSDLIKNDNERHWAGTGFQYTGEQLKRIGGKIQNMKVPFHVASTTLNGTENFIHRYIQYYWVLFIAIAFCLSGIFSKDSNSGLDELSLAARHGRKKDITAKLIAGNLFATMAHFFHAAMLTVINGLILFLSGLDNSIQLFWPTCVYSFSIGEGILVMLCIGWLTALAVANITMMISIMIGHLNLSVLAAMSFVCFLKYMTYTTQASKLVLNPLYFVTHFSENFDEFYFAGDWMVSYTAATSILGATYSILAILLIKLFCRRYRIN